MPENSRALTAYGLFNAGVCAMDVRFVTLQYLLERHGFRASKTGGPRCIAAVDALSKVAQVFDFGVLEHVLVIIAATWPADATVVRRHGGGYLDRYGWILLGDSARQC